MTATEHSTEQNRTALITGASSGLGYEFTKQFASDGYDVVLVARSEDRLEQIGADLEEAHDITATVFAKDLAVPGAAEELHEAVTREGIHVHSLVNNAAIATFGHFCETDWEREQRSLHLNLVTLTELTKRFARPMCERSDGQILNVSSLAGLAPAPKLSIYGASKSYVGSFSVALANELAEDGVTVTLLFPGTMKTPMLEKGGIESSAVPELADLEPKEVARRGYNGLQQEETIVVAASVSEKLGYYLNRVLPRTKAAAMARDTLEK